MTIRHYEALKPSDFYKSITSNHKQPDPPEPVPKGENNSLKVIIVSYSHWLMQLAQIASFRLLVPFFALSTKLQVARPSDFPTTASSRL